MELDTFLQEISRAGNQTYWMLFCYGTLLCLSVTLWLRARHKLPATTSDSANAAAVVVELAKPLMEPQQSAAAPVLSEAAAEPDVALKERLGVLEDYVSLLDGRQQTLEQWRTPRQVYSRAIIDADRGAGSTEIEKGFGLSSGEAELISAVYGSTPGRGDSAGRV